MPVTTPNGYLDFTNATPRATKVIATSNVGIGTETPAYELDVRGTANTGAMNVTSLNVTGNVYAELPIATIASNLVTYDKTTGQIFDSGGLFSNKLAVVSEQPPAALSGATTTIENHGTYIVEASSGTPENLFDQNESTSWAPTGDKTTIGGVTGHWVTLTLPYKATLRHLKMSATTLPTSIQVFASNNDGLTWISLVTASSPSNTVLVNATTSYKKYAFVVTDETPSIKTLQYFMESFSIDGGKVAMASSAVMGGETMMDQHGPHGRGAAVLKKYPEIVFEEGKFEFNDSTNTYTQAGYTVTASGEHLTENWGPAWGAFDDDTTTEENGWIPPSEFTGQNNQYSGLSTIGGTLGAWLKIKMTHKIRLEYIVLYPRYKYGSDSVSPYTDQSPKTFQILGSDNDNDWESLASFDNESQPNAGKRYTVNAIKHFKYIAIRVTRSNSNGPLVIGELKLYGYEELATQGDTSVDTTFTSVMNTPQTTGVKVYVDGNLGETFTNRVTGPTPTGTATSYNATGKYWELTGALTSNVTLEANTFLEGDAPHSVSVWFNSSNLEANTANTCVFSISDQEHLNSQNLDLQSNTWHNLTYAYQGEGGSRVTYLDGRKVAEDQAEDTFGEYPPFAMTGYSQGGYVVTASSEYDTTYPVWEAFNNVWHNNGNTNGSDTWLSENATNYNGVDGLYSKSPPSNLGTGAHNGEWVKIEMPHKFKLDYITIYPRYLHDNKAPRDFIVYGSNDNINWSPILTKTGASITSSHVETGHTFIVDVYDTCYKYFGLVTRKLRSNTTFVAIAELKFYGHRENDLVRLPDPTNVLKYPHIAMTGPAQRGYVANVSSILSSSYNVFSPFNGGSGVGHILWISESGGGHEYTSGSGNGQYTGDVRTVSVPVSGTGTENLDGEYVELELPHKIKLTDVGFQREYYAPNDIYGPSRMPAEGSISASNDGVTWYTIHSWTGLVPGDVSHTDDGYVKTLNGGTNFGIINTSSPNYGAYKYYRFIWQRLYRVGIVGSDNPGIAGCSEIEFYGTEEASSIPIQIGGGNIDKVANFRVYDKFIGEDQALEIWDAQKDTFRGVKNSATLHKGRLGIGTTEPEGRLAVLDEPHELEEFPPRAMTGYETYMEGHGEFIVRESSSLTVSATEDYLGWEAFDKNLDSIWYAHQTYTNGVYQGTSQLAPETSPGSWLVLEMPYKIYPKKVQQYGRSNGAQLVSAAIYYAKANPEDIWIAIHTQTSGPTNFGRTPYVGIINSDVAYKYFAIVVTSSVSSGGAANEVPSISNLKFFGTREQGQSVLHDGQLTLTKSLTVPRIGPALDADDTPRRDRLVVEYNTSTNPTFEGAVRDTSGRGFDGMFISATHYDATEKSIKFNGSSDGVELYIKNPYGAWIHTFSFWVKPTELSSGETILQLGSHSTNDTSSLRIESGTTFRWFFYDNDITYTNPLPLNEWHHVVAVYDGGSVAASRRLWVDGVEIAQAGTLTPGALTLPENARLRLGYQSGGNHFGGSISNFKLYDVALTAEEVKTLYDMGRCDEGHHVVNFSKTRVGIGLGDGEAPRGVLDVRGDLYLSGNIIRNTSSAKSGGAWLPTYQFEVGGATFVEDQRHGQYHIINNQLTAVYRARVVSNNGAGTIRISVPGGIQPAGHVTGNTIVIGWWARNSDLGATNVGPYLITNAGDGYAQLWHPGQTNGQVRLDGGSLEANQHWTVFLSYPVE